MNGSTTTIEPAIRPKSADSTSPQLSKLFAPIHKELAEVEEVFRRELAGRYPFVNQLVELAVGLGGKRLRPALLLLSGRALGRVTDEHILLAAVMEMIHTATLVHDDVLDEAELRRYRPTINATTGNEASVLLGDYLFSQAFYLASTLGNTTACQRIGQATNVVCQGELLQIHHRGNASLSEDVYLEMIDAKTAELCACCCHLGALYAQPDISATEAEAQLQAFARYGRCLGLAFQITDDLLDLTGEEDLTGKSLGTDLEKQKLTLPLIRLLDQADEDQRAAFETMLDQPAVESRTALLPYLEDTGALEYARGKAAGFARRAVEQLSMVPRGPARDVLAQMPALIVDRES